MKKIVAIMFLGVGLAGCQSTTRTAFYQQDRYDPTHIRFAREITPAHVDTKAYRPFNSSPVCYEQKIYHPGRPVEYHRRCFN
jgi:hypothetical protein